MNLTDFFAKNPSVALGLSGGVDSAYLLYAAVKNHAKVQPYFVKTSFQPAFELEDAKKLCAQLEIPLRVIPLDILSVEAVRSNPADRCYHCKAALFSALKAQASVDGYPLIIDGTNASDQVEDRPGMQALKELSVRSPLRECGLTKAQVRELSRKAGLFTWDKPAYACLATRVPTGQLLDQAELWKIEKAEEYLAAQGFRDFRIRVFHGAARIQLKPEQMENALCQREVLTEGIKNYFPIVLLDLEGR